MSIQFYEDDGTTPLGAEDLGEILNGAESDVLTCIAKNEGLVSVVPEFFVAAIDPTGSFDSDDLAFQNGWWQMRLVGAGGGASTQTTSWEPVGRDLVLLAEEMPPGSTRTIERKLVVPVDAGGSAVGSAGLVARYGTSSSPAWRQATDSGFGGIVRSRDASNTAVLSFSGFNVSTLDLSFDHVTFRHRGMPEMVSDWSDSITASASSMERWVTVSVGPGATVDLTDGTEVASVTEDDKADAPAGYSIIGYALVDDTEIVSTEATWTSGNEAEPRDGGDLAVLVDRCSVRVADRNATFTGGQTDVADDASSYVAVTRNGGLSTWEDTENRPQNIEPVAYVTASSGDIDQIIDIRPRRDRVVALGGFKAGTVGDNDIIAFGVWPQGEGRPCPDRPFAVAVSDTGGTSGSTVFNFEIWNGSTWDSVFTTGALPSIANDATDLYSIFPINTAFPPNSFVLRPGSVWRWRIEDVPGTASEDAFAEMYLEI